MPTRRNRNEFSSHTRSPHVMTGLYFFERLIVVDMLWPIVKIENDFGVAVGKETIDWVTRFITVVIDEMIDKLIQWKPRNVSLKNHCKSDRQWCCHPAGRSSKISSAVRGLSYLAEYNDSTSAYHVRPRCGRLTVAQHFKCWVGIRYEIKSPL